MKKLLGLTALAAVLVLSACGGSSDEIVCTIEDDTMGVQVEMTFTAQSEDDYITTVEVEGRIDVSELESDEAEGFAEAFGGTIDGDYIVFSETEDVTEAQITVEEFIEDSEAGGATCS